MYAIRSYYETLRHVHEVTGTGTLFRDADGVPLVHMHLACGRSTDTVVGCIREGVRVWHVMEVVIHELKNCAARREIEAPLGLKLLNCEHRIRPLKEPRQHNLT